MTSRQFIAERVIARARARGAPVDNDSEFLALVDIWVAGEIEADEMRDRYNALLEERSLAKRCHAAMTANRPTTLEATIVQAGDLSLDETA